MNTRKIIPSVIATAGIVIASVIGLEGGYSNHPLDPGKETIYGITESTARSNGYMGDMTDLPIDLAKQIYQDQYIVVPNYDMILQTSKAVGHKLIDGGVNVGTYRETLWFQKALNALNRGGKDYDYIKEDGIIGAATVSAYNSLVKVRGKVKACELVIKLLDAQQTVHYMSLTNHRAFTVGWVDNRIQNVSLEECSK